MEKEIKETLQSFRSAISEADGDGIVSSLRELDRLTQEAKGRIDPRLLHFLERRSYEKAGQWLEENAGAERGLDPEKAS